MCYAFNYSDEAESFEDDDAISGNMILQGLIEMPSSITSTVEPTGKPEFVLALSIVLVIFVIILIISIFLLLYCVLKRQGGRAERRKHDDYGRRRQHRMRPKTIVTDLARKAKVSQIAASIEAAVKSTESSSQLPKPSKQTPQLTAPQSPAILPKPKSISKKLPRIIPHTQSETAVEAPSVFINQTFVNRWRGGPWQQVDHEPSDFSFELESDSVNDDICLHPS